MAAQDPVGCVNSVLPANRMFCDARPNLCTPHLAAQLPDLGVLGDREPVPLATLDLVATHPVTQRLRDIPSRRATAVIDSPLSRCSEPLPHGTPATTSTDDPSLLTPLSRRPAPSIKTSTKSGQPHRARSTRRRQHRHRRSRALCVGRRDSRGRDSLILRLPPNLRQSIIGLRFWRRSATAVAEPVLPVGPHGRC